jgi:hypothetical protein
MHISKFLVLAAPAEVDVQDVIIKGGRVLEGMVLTLVTSLEHQKMDRKKPNKNGGVNCLNYGRIFMKMIQMCLICYQKRSRCSGK